MAGTILLDDAVQFYNDRLAQHAQDTWQGLQQAVQPAVQAVQSIQLPQVDPNAVASAQQALMQHAQDTWQAAQQQAEEQARQAAEQARQQAQAAQDQLDQARQQAAQQAQNLTSGFTAPDSNLPPAPSPLDQAAQQVRDLHDTIVNLRNGTPTGVPALDAAVQAAHDRGQDLGNSAVGQFAQGAGDVLEQRRQQSITDQANLGNQIIGGDVGGAAQNLLQQVGANSPLGGQEADLSGPVSAGLQRAGVDPNVSRVLGQVANLAIPVGGPATEAGAAERVAQQAPRLGLDAVSRFLSGTSVADLAQSEAGSVNPMLAARIGGAVAGGGAAALTNDPNAGPVEKGGKILAGAAAGAAAPSFIARPSNPAIDQAVLDSLRQAGLMQPASPVSARGAIATGVDVTKQFMLSNPITHISNTIGNTLELLRSPVGLTLGGRPADAGAGIAATMQAIPEAGRAAFDALKGSSQATLGTAAQTTRPWEPIFRLLGASDAFTRTLGEYQGMAEAASRLLDQAGMRPQDPGAAMYLANHAADLVQEGAQSGGQSVFQTLRTAAGGLPALDNLFNQFGRYKEGLLSSPDKPSQLLGALLDTQIPFSGVPSRILQIGLGRVPPVTQLQGGYKAIKALRANDIPAFQRAVGETAMESMIQAQIAQGIREGNIRGPDDPDHPNGVRILGNWLNASEWGGAYTLPMQIMAGFASGYDQAGNKLYATPSDEQLGRVSAGLSTSMKPLMQAVPGQQMIHLLAGLGTGTGLDNLARQEISDTVSRIAAPGAAKFVEDLSDPQQRDISKSLPGSLYQPAQARIPGLAGLLPARIDPTTGQPMDKRRAGLGILVGAQSSEPSALQVEANRLHRLGYDTAPPTGYPDKITINGADVPLKPDEQRAVAAITGQVLAKLGARMDDPAYANLPHTRAGEDRRAALMRAWLNAADSSRTAAVAKVLGQPELRQRIVHGLTNTGRYVNAGVYAGGGGPDYFSGFNPSSGANILDQYLSGGVDPNAEATTETYRRRAQALQEQLDAMNAVAGTLTGAGSR